MRGTFNFFPHGTPFIRSAYRLDAPSSGSIIVGLGALDTVVSSADGTFLVNNAPPGWTPTTSLRFHLNGEWELFDAGDSFSFGLYLSAPSYSQTGPGYFHGLSVGVDLPDGRSWFLLTTDLYEVLGALPTAFNIGLDRQVGVGFKLTGNYSILAYWWLVPDVSPCGDKQTGALQLASEQPGDEWQRLDPDDPDAAPTPVIDEVTPSHGPVAGGTEITLTGSGFGMDCDVQVDGVSCTDITYDSQYQVRATVPPHVAGNATVVLINADGVST